MRATRCALVMPRDYRDGNGPITMTTTALCATGVFSCTRVASLNRSRSLTRASSPTIVDLLSFALFLLLFSIWLLMTRTPEEVWRFQHIVIVTVSALRGSSPCDESHLVEQITFRQSLLLAAGPDEPAVLETSHGVRHDSCEFCSFVQ